MTPLGNLVLPSTDCVMATLGLIALRRNQDVIGKRTRKSQRVEKTLDILLLGRECILLHFGTAYILS